MPAVMEQVSRMSASEKLRLVAYIVNSLSDVVASAGNAATSVPSDAAGAQWRNGHPRPRVSDFIGYGARFHELRSTEEWMKELREGEEG